MAHKKAGGSTRNGRDSESKRLGVKKFGGQAVRAGKHHCPAAGQPLPCRRKRRLRTRLHAVRHCRRTCAVPPQGQAAAQIRRRCSGGVVAVGERRPSPIGNRPRGRPVEPHNPPMRVRSAMQFIDEAKIHVRAGKGGDGAPEFPPGKIHRQGRSGRAATAATAAMCCSSPISRSTPWWNSAISLGSWLATASPAAAATRPAPAATTTLCKCRWAPPW